MKRKRFGKEVGMIILTALIIISLAEVIFRVVIGTESFTTANYGELLVAIIFAVIILIMTTKGKDRICYILYSAWIAYFVLEKIYSLPARFTFLISNPENLVGITPLITQITYIIGMLCIIGIGVLLVEYINDGTIYNKAFNTLCIISVIMLLTGIVLPFYDVLFNGYDLKYALVGFSNLHQSVMVYLMACFAYDSAKLQLEKTKLSK